MTVVRSRRLTTELVVSHNGPGLHVTLNPSFYVPGNDQERRCIHFFRSRTVPQLSGHFSSDFWDRLVLQTTQHEPAIRHAVIAVGSIHERFELGDSSIFKSNNDALEGGFALQQYNQAIKHLIEPLCSNRQQALDVCLISCLLFACFEVRHRSTPEKNSSIYTRRSRNPFARA